jgi:hypothetical protein
MLFWLVVESPMQTICIIIYPIVRVDFKKKMCETNNQYWFYGTPFGGSTESISKHKWNIDQP